MENQKKTYVKSAGFVNNEYCVILSDDSILMGVTRVEIDKDVGAFGSIRITLNTLNEKKYGQTEKRNP